MQKRVASAEEMVSWTAADWPDGMQYYWHDLRKEKQIFSKRQSGGGSVMVWGAFSTHGTSQLAIFDGNQDSADYVNTLSEHLLPCIDMHYGRECVFQQDGASIHTFVKTKDFFEEQNVRVLGWPAKSPDLNPIENMWEVLARAVYAHGWQFMTKEELKKTILQSWAEISQNLIQNFLRPCKSDAWQF